MQDGLKNIISSIDAFTGTNLIQTTLSYLRASKAASSKIEKRELFNKEDEIFVMSMKIGFGLNQ